MMERLNLRRLTWIGATLFLLLITASPSWATHLRAGEITVRSLDCGSRQYEITITVYTRVTPLGNDVLFGGPGEYLDFGDGTRVEVPMTIGTIRPDLGEGIATASFTVDHSYSFIGRYTISYVEPNRNGGVLNMDNSLYTTFYLETQIDLTVPGCDNSPRLTIPPVDQACTGAAFFHNPGAFDLDDDSLSYEMVIPFRDRNSPVSNYRDPNNPGFYSGLNYNQANEEQNGPPTFSIDPVDGTLVWNAPGQAGEYNIAFNVRQWRRINGRWRSIGYVRRDMQIIVSDCDNERPDLIVPEDVCVEVGETVNAIIQGIDPDNHNVKIEAFSEVFEFTDASLRATVDPDPGVFAPQPAQLTFTWNTQCEHVKTQPYQVVFKVTDNPPTNMGPKLVTFKTWRITVVAPAPVLTSATADLVNRHADLVWEPYVCSDQAESIQIWRRVDTAPYVQEECVTGMPGNLGYELIAEVPANETTFKDTNDGMGLAVGASYCYRLVATFPLPRGGESYVSNEECTVPIAADAPVITNVSVERTGRTDGEIQIKWREPFDIDDIQYPPPYEYIVQRAESSDGPFASVVHSGRLTALEVNDVSLDTERRQYFYRVLLFVPAVSNDTPIDTSSVASSVRLSLDPGLDRMDMTWSAQVPWSNLVQDFPLHDIYRGPEGAVINADLVFLDPVDVFENGFSYSDSDPTLNLSDVYCYQVVTRGSYGNPAIAEPLINYSQIACAPLDDGVPPCTPTITASGIDCAQYVADYGCDGNLFTNEITWEVTDDCNEDIVSYNIYSAGSVNGNYTLLASGLIDLTYIDDNLPTLARCYRVSAVDKSGNESELSEPVCFDNCPYYELPNLFTPNGDACNDLFAAFGYEPNVGEEGPFCGDPGSGVSDLVRGKCARFVLRVDIKIFNRWGGEVYDYVGELGGENSIYIEWDGRDKNGRDLSSGIYYYSAEVTFDVVNPAERKKLIKGWVHLMR